MCGLEQQTNEEEGGVEHQSHISLPETADHPSRACEQKEKNRYKSKRPKKQLWNLVAILTQNACSQPALSDNVSWGEVTLL